MTLENRKHLGIAAALALLVAATHGHHLASALHLPPATWAAFFLAGLTVRRAGLFVFLLAEVVLLDALAVTIGGVSSYCLTPAYGFMLPAYGSLWLAGRWFETRFQPALKSLPALGASLLGGALLAELFSSGGFYFFSGRFTDTSLAGFGHLLGDYFPTSLQSFAFWMGIAIIAYLIASWATPPAGRRT